MLRAQGSSDANNRDDDCLISSGYIVNLPCHCLKSVLLSSKPASLEGSAKSQPKFGLNRLRCTPSKALPRTAQAPPRPLHPTPPDTHVQDQHD